jgi:UDP-glucose 4-epimerase
VYGDTKTHPTPEDAPMPIQNSLYAASKLSGEALISSFTSAFGMNGLVFRFVSVMGERYTHGHVFDFIKNLKQDPTRLKVLGNGHQKKSYMYVGDCINAIMHVCKKNLVGK